MLRGSCDKCNRDLPHIDDTGMCIECAQEVEIKQLKEDLKEANGKLMYNRRALKVADAKVEELKAKLKEQYHRLATYNGNTIKRAEKAEVRVTELEDRPDHGELAGMKLPAWMWCEEWGRKVYVIGRGIMGSQYAEVHNGIVSYLPIDGVESYTGQDMEHKKEGE